MKPKTIILLAFVLIVCVLAVLMNQWIFVSPALNAAVGQAILDRNQFRHSQSECAGEGHLVLGTEIKGEHVRVYALTMYGEYGFENGVFTKTAGSSVVPAVIEFDKKDNAYIFTKLTYSQNGTLRQKSINEMFPWVHRLRIEFSKMDEPRLQAQEKKYAEDYLKAIGRTAQILPHSDFEHILLRSRGISTAVANKVPFKVAPNYPYWIGTREIIENGTRMVYELSYEENDPYIILRKYEYDTNKEVEIIRYDATTGERVKESAVER